MPIPFLHSTAAGLLVTPTELVWVSATARLRWHLRGVRRLHEPVADGDVLAALRRLVARARPAHPYVITHLDPLHVRHAVVQAPVFDDAALFDAWLAAEVTRHLPPRAALADVVVRYQVLDATEEYVGLLLALASRNAVAERVALMQAAGLEPLGITSLDAATGEALLLHPALLAGPVALLHVRPDDAVLVLMQEGVLQAWIPLPRGSAGGGAAALLQEVAPHLVPLPDRLCIVGAEAAALVHQASAKPEVGCPVHAATLDLVAGGDAVPLPAREIPAAALALQHLFVPAPDAINFLEPERVEQGRVAVEKREATRAILALGAVTGVLFLVVTLLLVFLEGQRAASEAALRALGDQVALIDQMQGTVTRLEQEIEQAERLVVERTHVARVLDAVGRAVPEGIWLEGLGLEAGPTGAPHLTLHGVAFAEAEVATYLDRLEQAAFAEDVHLRYAEQVRAGTLYRQARLADRPLVRFEVLLGMALPGRAGEAAD